MAAPATEISEFDAHCRQVVSQMARGCVVPLLGAGANLCGRVEPWDPGVVGLPSGRELAEHLADVFSYPERSHDLVRITQYVTTTLGAQPLYQELHTLFAAAYGPTELHRLLARVPRQIQSLPQAPLKPHPLVVTTNYDDALEQAYREQEQEFDLVTYVADGDDRGRFVHQPPDDDAEPVVIEKPNEYHELLRDRPVILKIHGAIDRADEARDSYVITEDDYIDYLTRTDVGRLPVTLAARLRASHVLFLGYSLRDWNLRAIFHGLWLDRRRSSASWAIQHETDTIEVQFWQARGVHIRDMPLEEYVSALETRFLEYISEKRG
jgi:hypothetical protein